MNRVSAIALVRLALLACSALGMFILAGSEVRAECGDYVLARGSGLQPEASNVRTSAWRLANHSNPRPCYGPACSNRDPIPAAPTKALGPSVPDWALPASPVTMAGTEPVLLELVLASPSSTHRFKPILRPPRIS